MIDLTEWRLLPASEKDDPVHPYLSVSACKTYLVCPRQYYYQKVQRIGSAQPTSIFMEIGTIAHEVLAEINRVKLEQGAYPRMDHASVYLDAEIAKSVVLSPAEKVSTRKTLYKLLCNYLSVMAIQLEPLLFEDAFLMEHQPSGMRVYGLVDLTEATALWDYKVSREMNHAMKHSDQLSTYALAFRLVSGTWPLTVGIITLVRTSGEVIRSMIRCEESDVLRSLDEMKRVWYHIQAKQFAPNLGSACSRCTFATAERCPEGVAHLARAGK